MYNDEFNQGMADYVHSYDEHVYAYGVQLRITDHDAHVQDRDAYMDWFIWSCY